MGCLKRLIAIFLGCLCVSVNIVSSEDDEVDKILDFFQDERDWREVIVPEESRAFPDSHPTQQFDDQLSVPKRRRLRKRKRRPLTTTSTEAAQSYEEYYGDTLPEQSEQISTLEQSWEDMLQEPQVPYNKRRKNPPKYDLGHANPTLTTTLRFGNSNDETSKSNIDTEKTAENSGKSNDIKALLKQSGKVSLSEILQKRNLTLSELLKGNRKAISALRSTTTEHSEGFAHSRKVEPKVVHANMKFEPPKILAASKKETINRIFNSDDYSTEIFKEQDAIKQPSTQNYNNMYSGVTKFEVVAEPTTEKRIFVPSHPVLYTSVTYKNQPPLQVDLSTPQPKTSTINPTYRQKNFTSTNKNLPLTNAELYKRIQLKDTFPQDNKGVPKTTLPPNVIKIDITEIFGFVNKKTFDPLKNNENNIDKNTDSKSEEGPLKVSIELDFTTSRTTTTNKTTPTRRSETTTQKVQTLPNKFQPLTPRDEIIEIIKYPRDKENLLSILERRNMTLEELIEQRKRGSSHTHLADIFHNKIKEPEPSGETFIGHMDMPKNYPLYMRKQKSLLDDVTTSTSTTTLISSMGPQNVMITSFPAVKIEMQKNAPEKPRVNKEKVTIPDSIQFTDSREEDRIVLLDDNFLEDNIPIHNSDGKLYIPSEPLYLDEEIFLNVPSGVKSAILASFAIIGLSILVFLSILVVFRWNQKRKKKLNYCESFGFRNTKSPIISVPNKRIKTFVNETLGKNKNPYKSYMHTSMDNLWETKLRANY